MYSNKGGQQNVAVGLSSMQNNGTANVAIGYNALEGQREPARKHGGGL